MSTGFLDLIETLFDPFLVGSFLPRITQNFKENQKLTAKPFPVKKYGLERAKVEVPWVFVGEALFLFLGGGGFSLKVRLQNKT